MNDTDFFCPAKIEPDIVVDEDSSTDFSEEADFSQEDFNMEYKGKEIPEKFFKIN